MKFKRFQKYQLNEVYLKDCKVHYLWEHCGIIEDGTCSIYDLFFEKIQNLMNINSSESFISANHDGHHFQFISNNGIFQIINIENTSYVGDLIWIITWLAKKGINFLNCYWYFVESDATTYPGLNFYSFFITNGDRIALEKVVLTQDIVPAIHKEIPKDFFITKNEFAFLNEEEEEEAETELRYRIFFNNTEYGRLIKEKEDIENIEWNFPSSLSRSFNKYGNFLKYYRKFGSEGNALILQILAISILKNQKWIFVSLLIIILILFFQLLRSGT